MNRKKYLIFATVLSLLCMNKAYAACTQQDINDFKKIEDEYKITYKFDKETKHYILNIYSPLPDKYDFVLYMTSDLKCNNLDTNTVECTNAPSGEHKIEIIGQTANCNDILKSYTLKLPKYNKYADDPLCEGYEEFVLCQPTYDKEIDYETFLSRLNTYKKTNNKKEETEKIEDDNKIQQYLKENIIKLIIIVIFIVLVIITSIITAKSIRKSRRLE